VHFKLGLPDSSTVPVSTHTSCGAAIAGVVTKVMLENTRANEIIKTLSLLDPNFIKRA
jgi:hypothetical protein